MRRQHRIIPLLLMALLGAAPALADGRWNFDGWTLGEHSNDCRFGAVGLGNAPAYCDGMGFGPYGSDVTNAYGIVDDACRSGRCLKKTYTGGGENALYMYPDVSNSTFWGTLPNGSAGGYFSYWYKPLPGGRQANNSWKNFRITNGSTVIVIGAYVFDSGEKAELRNSSATSKSNIDGFNPFDHLGRWIHFEVYVDVPSGTVKQWITVEGEPTRTSVETNFKFDALGANRFYLLGNFSDTGGSGGFTLLVDDVCIAANESARDSGGFCETGVSQDSCQVETEQNDCNDSNECTQQACSVGIPNICQNSVLPDGTPCTGGSCESGACVFPLDAPEVHEEGEWGEVLVEDQ